MPYTQNWGVSRSQSPFNALIPPVEKKEEKEFVPEVDTSPDADEDIIEQNNEIANTETRTGLDRFQDVLTLGGMITGPVGAGLDLLNTAISGGRSIHSLVKGDTKAAGKHAKNAVLYGLSSVPGAGDAFAYANIIKKGTTFAEKGSKMAKLGHGIGIGESAMSTYNLSKDLSNPSQKTPLTTIPTVISGFAPKIAAFFATNTENKPKPKIKQEIPKSRINFKPGTGRGMNIR